jgi:hypothetical protein
LGALTDSEVVELLKAGFLMPTDFFWTAGMADWQTLAEFNAPPGTAAGVAGFVKSATRQVAAASGAVAAGTARVTRQIRSVAGGSSTTLAKSTTRALDVFTPRIRELVSRQLLEQSFSHVQASLRDDEFMRKLFGATYDCLPKPVYRFVSEQAFIAFCMERRSELLGEAGDRSSEK